MPGCSRTYGSVDATHRGVRGGDTRFPGFLQPGRVLRTVVVVNRSRALLALGDGGVEVEVEVTVERRCPYEAPAHAALVGLQRRDRGPRDRDHRNIVMLQMDGGAVEAIGDRRAGRATAGVVGSEHEVVDEELRAPTEQVSERCGAGFGLEPVVLLDRDPGQFLATAGEVVTAAGQLFLGLEQLEAGGEPLLAARDGVGGNHFDLLVFRVRRWRRRGRSAPAPVTCRRRVEAEAASGRARRP
jgi:hypothetical protein